MRVFEKNISLFILVSDVGFFKGFLGVLRVVECLDALH